MIQYTTNAIFFQNCSDLLKMKICSIFFEMRGQRPQNFKFSESIKTIISKCKRTKQKGEKEKFMVRLEILKTGILDKLFFLIIQSDEMLIIFWTNCGNMDIVCPQLPCSSGFFNLKITMQTQITFCLCMHQHHQIPF